MEKNTAFLIIALLLLAIITACSGSPKLQHSEFGIKAARKGLWKEAAFRWKKALELQPNNANIHNNLAVAYENFGEYEKALQHYKIALKLDPGNYYIKSNAEEFELFYQKLQAKEEKKKKEEPKDLKSSKEKEILRNERKK